MSQELRSTLKSIGKIKTSISLLSEEIKKLESDVKLMLENYPTKGEESNQSSLKTKSKPQNKVVRRIDDAEGDVPSDEKNQPPKYDIKVVGLGVEIIKE